MNESIPTKPIENPADPAKDAKDAIRLTGLEVEILYTLWLSKAGGNGDGLQFKEVHALTNARKPCKLDSVKKTLQRLKNRRQPFPPVVSEPVPEDDNDDFDSRLTTRPGRRASLWFLDRDHLVTLPDNATILKLAYQWPQSCINENQFMVALNRAGITDEVFLSRLPFMFDSYYLKELDPLSPENYASYYQATGRTIAEISYIRKIAEHFHPQESNPH